DDPEKDNLLKDYGSLFKAYVLPNCSCEGIARHLFDVFKPMVRDATDGRAWIISVEVEEDSKNSAKFCP
ncbi:MAG: 6-carboxytetrahydropterin synthase, partial [Opitutales bacterium]